MKSFPINEIPPLSYFTRTVYLDQNFTVASPEMPFTEELAKTLNDWDFTEVYSEGEPKENYLPDESGDGAENTGVNKSTISDLDKLRKARQIYEFFIRDVETVYAQAAVKKSLNIKAVAENVKKICDFIKEDRRFIMRVLHDTDPVRDDDYLVSHTAKSSIIAIIIGTYIKFPSHRLIELGTAALLHEIGMIQLPPQSYLSENPLSEHDKKLIYAHPVLAFKILKTSNFPLVISLAVLEHHERENGSGYPQKLTSEKISLYAKIISVACSYEAITSKRPHREAKDGYTSMLELLKNEGKQYDDRIIKALVYSLSIYPIGLHVMLSNGKKGQVIDVNPEQPRYPIVQIFGELMPDGKNKIMQTSADTIFIERPLSHDEIDG